jgi:hypothetical protein
VAEMMSMPSHCAVCGVLLQGGATIHLESCPLYAISYQGIKAKAARACVWCEEPVEVDEGDDRFSQPMHWECGFRSVAGSVAHIEHRCGCYIPSSERGDPPGMTKREAARAAVQAAGVVGPAPAAPPRWLN